MPGIVKVWWHDGATKDVRYNELPIANEPELAFESLVIGPIAVETQPAPVDATVAIVEASVGFRYRVVPPEGGSAADLATCKPIAATGFGTDSIGVRPGYRISIIEA